MPPRRAPAESDELDPPLAAGGRAAAAAVVHQDRRSARDPLSDDEEKATIQYKILAQFKTPKDIRISVKGEYWEHM